MFKRSADNLFEDIKEAADRIASDTNGMNYDDFRADDKTIDAVIRNFRIINEAAKHIPDEYKAVYTEIPWGYIEGFSEESFGVNYDDAWEIKEKIIPILIEYLEEY